MAVGKAVGQHLLHPLLQQGGTAYQYHGNCRTTVSCSTRRRCSTTTSKPSSPRTEARSRTVTPGKPTTASTSARFTRELPRSGWASRTRVRGSRDAGAVPRARRSRARRGDRRRGCAPSRRARRRETMTCQGRGLTSRSAWRVMQRNAHRATRGAYRHATAIEEEREHEASAADSRIRNLPLYAIGCLSAGAAIFIAARLRDASLGAVIAGIGFALYGVSAYRDPVVFRKPLLAALARPPIKGPIELGLDLIAIVAIACGLLVLWWGEQARAQADGASFRAGASGGASTGARAGVCASARRGRRCRRDHGLVPVLLDSPFSMRMTSKWFQSIPATDRSDPCPCDRT